MDAQQAEAQFISLIFTFHQSAMFALGKMANPMTGKVERSLPQAKQSIDILEMLQEKAKGNLSEQEEKFLQNTLQELRLNYVYETEQEKNNPEDSKDKPAVEDNSEENTETVESDDTPTTKEEK